MIRSHALEIATLIMFMIVIGVIGCISSKEGYEKALKQYPPRSYQLDIQDEWTIVMYDGDRVVHVFRNSDSSSKSLFEVTNKDNE